MRLVVWLCAFAICGSLTCKVRADAALLIDRTLAREALNAHGDLLVDDSGALTIEDVVQPTNAARFVARTGTPTARYVGFSDATFWLRLPVENRTSEPVRWLLEVAYPHLDEVTLYTPRAQGGFSAQQTGDHEPLASRDVPHTSFVFRRTEPPHTRHHYYVRVRSQGPVNLTMVAWSTPAFFANQGEEWLGYGLFYGAVLLMTAASLCTFLFGVQAEASLYSLYLVSVVLCVATLAGHTQQLLLPDHPGLVQRMLPFSIALPFVLALQVVRTEVAGLDVPGKRRLRWIVWFLASIACATLVLPYRLSLPLVLVNVMSAVPLALAMGAMAARTGSAEAKLMLTAFSFPLAGGAVYALQLFGLYGSEDFGRWSVPIGVSAQVVVLSTSYALRINSARADIARVNLARNAQLEAVRSALVVARSAMQAAERDTALRDQFIGTMSHELLTPLNAIINIPEGIASQFEAQAVVVCSGCQTLFRLDPGERLEAAASCPECAAHGTLVQRQEPSFEGDAASMRHLLQRLERCGQGLLRNVNGILDFSKLQAGHFKLARERINAAQALARAVRTFQSDREDSGKHTLSVVPVDAALELDADPQCLEDVLLHLLDNAVKFSSPGSAVQLSARVVDGECVVSVRDHGIGIAAEDTRRIFDSFEQVSSGIGRRYGGTGLGLAICAAMLRAHDGRIWVESALGEGSTFSFTFSAARRATPSVHLRGSRSA